MLVQRIHVQFKFNLHFFLNFTKKINIHFFQSKKNFVFIVGIKIISIYLIFRIFLRTIINLLQLLIKVLQILCTFADLIYTKI